MTSHPKIQQPHGGAGDDGTALSLIPAQGLSPAPAHPGPDSPGPVLPPKTMQGEHHQGLTKANARGLQCATCDCMSYEGSGEVRTILSGPDNPLKNIYPIFIPLPCHLLI